MLKNIPGAIRKRFAATFFTLTMILTSASPVLAQTTAAATTAATAAATAAKSGNDQIAGVDKPLALLIIGGLVVLTLINMVTIARRRRK